MAHQPRLTPASMGEAATTPRPATPVRVKVSSLMLDLPGERLERIELDAGCPVNEWGSPPSGHRLLAAIVADQVGGSFAEYRKLTLRELNALITIVDEDDDGEDDGPGEASATSTPAAGPA